MQDLNDDLNDDLSEAFKSRDLGWIERYRGAVFSDGDADMRQLWVSYCALLEYKDNEEAWCEDLHASGMTVPASTEPVIDALLARLDTAWTAYLALRAQHAEGETT
jgi:hypothetical protein